jgi:uncharacterized protein
MNKSIHQDLSNIDIYFINDLNKIINNSKLLSTKQYIAHGNTSCLLHSIAVAYYSYKVAKYLKIISYHEKDLIRGALLHDYYLYDWHEKDSSHRLHGFYHPGKALRNAESDFNLNNIERDIIKKHMFPLTLSPPRYRESILVCIVDKICSLYETFKIGNYQNLKNRLEFNTVVNLIPLFNE